MADETSTTDEGVGTDASTQPSDNELIQPGGGRQVLADQAAAAAAAQATKAEADAAALRAGADATEGGASAEEADAAAAAARAEVIEANTPSSDDE